ncbi:MAG: thiamine diphosphokinase [Romboutsia sp.]
MKVGIVLNGEVKDYNFIKNIIKNNYDYLICADGGANHTYKMGIVPDYIIGDLDSVHEDVIKYYKDNNVKFEKFPSKKNETDSQLCIYLANKLNATNIDFFGALGGREDHMISNINLLYYVRTMGITPKIISEKSIMYIAINEEIGIVGKKGETISVIPLSGQAKGVTLINLEYPLNNYDMDYGVPLGISNVMLKDICSIKVSEGNLLIIRNM